ncbi:MAG: AAA family ATPase [Bacteroidetes bacterium]|nr:AAA family ATPase [Bacteroidota bacterium]
MSESSFNELHLPDLQITNFRCIDHLSIGKLGRVTLIAGHNEIGKTTILEAVRIYADRGRYDSLIELLDEREEFVTSFSENQKPVAIPDYDAFFFDRNGKIGDFFSIGTLCEQENLKIKIIDARDLPDFQPELFVNATTENTFKALSINYKGSQYMLPWTSEIGGLFQRKFSHQIPPSQRRRIALSVSDSDMPDSINTVSLGPGLPKNDMFSRYWDKIALTEEEAIVLDMLRLTGQHIDRIAVVGDERSRYGSGSKIIVKIQDHPQRFPLRSFGDGLTRLFATGLALTASRNGFLLIDEVENGVHYSVQDGFWKMIFKIAQQYNIQVLATTHSFDCVKAFAQASNDNPDAEGALIRLSNKTGQLQAVEYNEEEILIASEQNIEVR